MRSTCNLSQNGLFIDIIIFYDTVKLSGVAGLDIVVALSICETLWQDRTLKFSKIEDSPIALNAERLSSGEIAIEVMSPLKGEVEAIWTFLNCASRINGEQ